MDELRFFSGQELRDSNIVVVSGILIPISTVFRVFVRSYSSSSRVKSSCRGGNSFCGNSRARNNVVKAADSCHGNAGVFWCKTRVLVLNFHFKMCETCHEPQAAGNVGNSNFLSTASSKPGKFHTEVAGSRWWW